MKAIEVARVFEQIAPPSIGLQGDRDAGHLGFRFGDPDVEVTGLGVAWFLSMEVIVAAMQKRLNLLLIHEPSLFYRNRAAFHTSPPEETNPVNLKKKWLLIEHGISVYTAHSNWDLQPTVGMQPTFAKALGLTDEITRDKAVGFYRIDPVPFEELAGRIKQTLGLEHVRVQGDPKKPVTTLAVGFGNMGFIVDAILAGGADAGVFGELGEFSFIAAREADVGLIETTHLVSESIGFRSAVGAMAEKLPDLSIEFLEVPFGYRWI